MQDLADEPFIMKENGSGTRKAGGRVIRRREDAYANTLMETSNTEFIKQLVQRGEGVSFVVKEAVAAELKDKKLATVPVRGPKIYLDVSIAYMKGQILSPPAKAFVDTLRKLKAEDIHPMGIGMLMTKIMAQRRKAESER